MEALLTIRALDKHYGPTPVLTNVSLDVMPGEFVILIGGSGSGKTTLLRIVAGLERASAGTVHLRGELVDEGVTDRFLPPERRRLGMVFQDYALWPHMTALQTVEAALPGPPGARRAQALDLLEKVGVGTMAKRQPAQLSGGQQQRVGLARALAAASDLVLFDEPLSSLDVDVREQMRLQIRALMRERAAAALFVSHDPVDAWRLADRVAVLEHGRIVQAATPAQIYARPATARIARFTDAVGGFQVSVHREGAAAGLAFAGSVQPAHADGLADGETGRVFVRPCGVRSGAEGEPARLMASTFEAGGWRATWLLPFLGWTLCSFETAPPALETRLCLVAEHVFIYPEEKTE